MQKPFKQKLIVAGLLIAAVVAIVEFQKFMQRRVPACENGVCAVPAEYAAAKVTGPQTVPFMPPARMEERPLPKLLDFGDGQCASCKMMDVVLDELAQATGGKLIVQYVDTQKQAEVAAQYAIRTVPVQLFFDAQGKELFRHEGFLSTEDIVKQWAALGVSLPASGE